MELEIAAEKEYRTGRLIIIQTGRRGFETLEGSVLDKAQYNQAYKDQLHTNKTNGFQT